MSIFLPHKDPKNQSHWAPVLGGHLTAAGAPPPQSLGRWAEAGATDVVTLLRDNELRYSMGEICRAHGLGWHHLPLSGRKLEAASDLDSLRQMGDIAALLAESPARRVVVHCAAGLHRTGVSLYLIARCAGLDPRAAEAVLAAARGLTAEEFARPAASGLLREKAEGYFQRLFAS